MLAVIQPGLRRGHGPENVEVDVHRSSGEAGMLNQRRLRRLRRRPSVSGPAWRTL